MVVSQGRAALVSSLQHGALRPAPTRPGASRRAARPVPLPTFSGNGAVVILDDVGQYDRSALTVEPSGGSQTPSSAPFAAATL